MGESQKKYEIISLNTCCICMGSEGSRKNITESLVLINIVLHLSKKKSCLVEDSVLSKILERAM